MNRLLQSKNVHPKVYKRFKRAPLNHFGMTIYQAYGRLYVKKKNFFYYVRIGDVDIYNKSLFWLRKSLIASIGRLSVNIEKIK